MGVSQISRFHDMTTGDVVFGNSLASTGSFVMALHSGALLMCRSTSTGSAVTLTFYAKPSPDDASSFAVADTTNSVLTLTVQPNRCYQLPDELFAASYVQAVTDTGTATCKIQMKG